MYTDLYNLKFFEYERKSRFFEHSAIKTYAKDPFYLKMLIDMFSDPKLKRKQIGETAFNKYTFYNLFYKGWTSHYLT